MAVGVQLICAFPPPSAPECGTETRFTTHTHTHTHTRVLIPLILHNNNNYYYYNNYNSNNYTFNPYQIFKSYYKPLFLLRKS